MGSKLVVSVSQSAVVQAESAIFGCARCTPESAMPFWRVLDRARSYVEEDIAYILPALAACPKCRGPIDENTLVAPKPRRKSMSLALLFRRLVRSVKIGSPSTAPNPAYHEKSKSGPDSSPERPREDFISQ